MDLIILGALLTMVAYLFFRKEGQPFFAIVPIWKINQYLKPVGIAIYFLGLVLGISGAVLFFTSL